MIKLQNNMKKKQIKPIEENKTDQKIAPTKRITYKDLEPNHWRFITAYFKNNFNGTEAYKEVYPESSHESAMASASRLLAMPLISQAVDEKREELAFKDLITLERILLRLDKRATDDSTRASDRNQADMLLSKLCGYLNEEKIQVNVIGGDDLTEIRRKLQGRKQVNSITQETKQADEVVRIEDKQENKPDDIKPDDSMSNDK